MEPKTRCFIALDLPENIRSELSRVQTELKKLDLIVGGYTEADAMHLTLKFLGSISTEAMNKVRRLLKTVNQKKFDAFTEELGIFSEEFIRIVWISLGGKEVHELQGKIDYTLHDLYKKEERFMSHITISRVKNIKNKEAILDFVKKTAVNKVIGNITSFSLMKSTLMKEGARHEVIEKYELT